MKLQLLVILALTTLVCITAQPINKTPLQKVAVIRNLDKFAQWQEQFGEQVAKALYMTVRQTAVENEGVDPSAWVYPLFDDMDAGFDAARELAVARRSVKHALFGSQEGFFEKEDSVSSLLYAAVIAGKGDLVDVLVRYGADVNAVDDDAKPSLLWCAVAHNDVAMVEHLLRYGARVDETESGGYWLLTRARENPEMTRVLRKAGAKINADPRDELTSFPVMMASLST